jgi:hypothetical protein
MKIAYIVLAHIDPSHIARLVNKITQPEWADAFIHIDAKSDIEPFKALLHDNGSAHFLDDRTAVYWGGYSSVVATIKLFKAALAYGEYDRFVILQGLDYPIRSNTEIYNFFEKNKNTEFIKARNATELNNDRYKYHCVWFLDATNIFKICWNRMNEFLLKHHRLLELKSADYDIYSGWAHIALTRNCVSYIVEYSNSHPEYNKYFKTVYASDESYFHTIVYHSDFIRKTVDGKCCNSVKLTDRLNLTYFEKKSQVTIFKDESDFIKLYGSGYLFFRKAATESKPLLDLIDSVHNTAIT